MARWFLGALLGFLLAAPAHGQVVYVWRPYGAWYYGGYTPWVYNPIAGYLHGLADLNRSRGEVAVNFAHAANLWQSARLKEQEVYQKMLETRRKALEHYRWETEFRLRLPNEIRQIKQEERLKQMTDFATTTHIAEASAHNTLLDFFKKNPGLLDQGDSVPIPEGCLPKINLTFGRNNDGNRLWLFRKEGGIPWPLLLQDDYFKPEREKIDRLAAKVLKQIRESGGMRKEDFDPLNRAVNDLWAKVDSDYVWKRAFNRQLSDDGKEDWDRYAYWKAKQFVPDLRMAMRDLQAEQDTLRLLFVPPNVKTVADLVKHMLDHGLRFGRATEEQLRYYRMLYDAMATEFRRVESAGR